MSLRTIRQLWVLGNAAVLLSLVLPQPAAALIVMAVADVALTVAWVWALGRACASRKWGWAIAMAICPLAVWVYIFRRHDEVPRPSQPAPSDDAVPVGRYPSRILPYDPPGLDLLYPPFASNWEPDEPLALRQARAVVTEAEQRYPDW